MFTHPLIPRVHPNRPILARSIEGLREAADGRDRSRAGPELPTFEVSGAQLIRKNRPPSFHARLAGLSGTGPAYVFAEVYGVPTPSQWAAYPGGRTGTNAYELNGLVVPSSAVVELHPVGGGAWYWFQWRSKSSGSGTGTGGTGTIPGCFCTDMPINLTMTSASETCNFGMFQSCTISYQPVPACYAELDLGANAYISNESFVDVLSGGATFQYLLLCQFNQFLLTRIYCESPFGSPWQDAILYSWFVGSYGNVCSPFHLDNGVAYPGSDVSCFVTIDQA